VAWLHKKLNIYTLSSTITTDQTTKSAETDDEQGTHSDNKKNNIQKIKQVGQCETDTISPPWYKFSSPGDALGQITIQN